MMIGKRPGRSSSLPLVLITSLFFLWGLSYGLLDVLNKHFQEVLAVGKQHSALLQTAYFGAYFIMALPAGWIMQRKGYKFGVLTGLTFFAAGALLFYPASLTASFSHFLFALFLLACGLAILETAANPFMTVIGPSESAAYRLNLAQSFNGVGSLLGPLLGGFLFFGDDQNADGLGQVRNVYLVISAIVLLLAFVIFRTPMPEPGREEQASSKTAPQGSGLRSRRFITAVVAQFSYVAAQVGIAAFFINYTAEPAVGCSNASAAYFLSLALALFTAGRFTGSLLMKRIDPARLLTVYAVINVFLCAWIAAAPAAYSVYLLVVVFFFESIMFPTIFALGVADMGPRTKFASSILVMSIVGGAVVPYLMGAVAESFSTAQSYLIPAVCFAVVALFGAISTKSFQA
jgi:FHS family L-fucose permease-like MFS transporter